MPPFPCSPQKQKKRPSAPRRSRTAPDSHIFLLPVRNRARRPRFGPQCVSLCSRSSYNALLILIGFIIHRREMSCHRFGLHFPGKAYNFVTFKWRRTGGSGYTAALAALARLSGPRLWPRHCTCSARRCSHQPALRDQRIHRDAVPSAPAAALYSGLSSYLLSPIFTFVPSPGADSISRLWASRSMILLLRYRPMPVDFLSRLPL